MARQGSPNFEIPAEMRALAEKSVEQARQAFDTFVSAANQAATSADKKAADARAGAKGIGALAIQFAERNIASSFEFVQQLVRAASFEEVMALHSDYVKRQMATLGDQAKELTKEAAKVGQQATQH
jgi:phasin